MRFYTTVPRYVGGVYVDGSVTEPAEFALPKDNPKEGIKGLVEKNVLGRTVKVKTKTRYNEKKKIKAPFETKDSRGQTIKGETEVEVDVPVEVEEEKEQYTLHTKEELAARGLIVTGDDDPPPEGAALKPHFAKGNTGAPAAAAHTRDKLPARPSDTE